MSINSINSNYVNTSATQSLNTSQTNLASGTRINSAADDAAGLQIANRLTSQIDGNGQAVANSMSGISVTQIAQGGLESITKDLSSLRELAVQAGNGIYSDSDRQALQQQANALLENIQGTIGSTTFAGQELLSSDSTLDFQVGPDANSTMGVNTNDVSDTLTTNGLFAFDITNQASLDSALSAVDSSLENIDSLQAEYGATQNAFSSRVDALLESQANESAARSRIQDTDFAGEVSNQVVNSILERSSVAVQSQANADASRVLNLLTN
ncbi:Flagellin [Marinomonas gallaica]|uniref:Flagellin n=1 Tax=Marinomonas gallaica TaxID=1806667 RepID=A0A1C3JRZ7_9GAMM|nr:flagellin [Marinomonas gallaica]SBT17887.1 Flagellin [Marinomonas gallaica]SBT22027.1 Flagellin [Marinomonas gallaica]